MHTQFNTKAWEGLELYHSNSSLLEICYLEEAFPKEIQAGTKQTPSAMTYQTHNKTIRLFDP